MIAKTLWWLLVVMLAVYGWLYHLPEAEAIYARTRT